MAGRFRLADPREYRRGVVLGLTLAEVLVLLVFLLLLSMAALLLRKDREQASLVKRLDRFNSQLAPLTQALASRGVVISETDQLVSLIERGKEVENLRAQILDGQQKMEAAERDAEADAKRISQLVAAERASADAIKDAAQYSALAAVVERLPGQASETPSEKLQRVIQREAASETVSANLTGQNAQMRGELARLKGNGGSGLPYCWTLSNGQAQYMLNVEMQDKGVVIRDIEPRARPDDPAWPLLDTVPRGQLLQMADFIGQVGALQARGNTDKCRYAIQAFDATAATNIAGYKQSMGRLWSVFMVREVFKDHL